MGFIKKIHIFFYEETGVSAIEFAILGPIFLGVLFSVFELGRLMIVMLLLDSGIQDAVHNIVQYENSLIYADPTTTAVAAIQQKSFNLFTPQACASPTNGKACIQVNRITSLVAPTLIVVNASYMSQPSISLLRTLLGQNIIINSSAVAISTTGW